MVQNALIEIKGRFVEMMFEQYRDMNSFQEGGKTEVDYEEFYTEFIPVLKEITNIGSLNDLEQFCEEFGMNDLDNVMSFPGIVKEYYDRANEPKRPSTKK